MKFLLICENFCDVVDVAHQRRKADLVLPFQFQYYT